MEEFTKEFWNWVKDQPLAKNRFFKILLITFIYFNLPIIFYVFGDFSDINKFNYLDCILDIYNGDSWYKRLSIICVSIVLFALYLVLDFLTEWASHFQKNKKNKMIIDTMNVELNKIQIQNQIVNTYPRVNLKSSENGSSESFIAFQFKGPTFVDRISLQKIESYIERNNQENVELEIGLKTVEWKYVESGEIIRSATIFLKPKPSDISLSQIKYHLRFVFYNEGNLYYQDIKCSIFRVDENWRTKKINSIEDLENIPFGSQLN